MVHSLEVRGTGAHVPEPAAGRAVGDRKSMAVVHMQGAEERGEVGGRRVGKLKRKFKDAAIGELLRDLLNVRRVKGCVELRYGYVRNRVK